MPYRVLILLLLSLIAKSSLAAVPQKVKYIEDIVLANDEIYAYYVVSCSDGREVDVSAFDDKKLWCVGKGVKDACEAKQIKIAKQVCKDGAQ